MNLHICNTEKKVVKLDTLLFIKNDLILSHHSSIQQVNFMKKTFFYFIFIIYFLLFKDKKAKDIVVAELNTPCECVNSLYIVALKLMPYQNLKMKWILLNIKKIEVF